MKICFLFLLANLVTADTVTITDSIGLQRAKAEVEVSSKVSIKLSDNKNIALFNGKENLVPTTRESNVAEFADVTPGNWKIKTDAKVLEVKITDKK